MKPLRAEYARDDVSYSAQVDVPGVHASGMIICREVGKLLPGVMLVPQYQLRHMKAPRERQRARRWNARDAGFGGMPINFKTWSGK